MQVCGYELMAWSSNAGRGEGRVRELWTSGQRKQNSRRKRTMSYLDRAARICRLVLKASYVFSVPRKIDTGIYARHTLL